MLMRFAVNSSRGTSSSTTVPKPACAFRRISTIAKMNVILRSRKWKRSSKRARGKNMLRRLRMLEKKEYAAQRAEMIEKQLRRRGVIDPVVLAAMATVPRHEFVPEEVRSHAYDDLPLPIGGGQTISQPYIVAAMTAALHLQPADRVLEIGTGCGYQAALLSPPGCWRAADLCLLSATTAGRNLPDDERSRSRPLHHHSFLQRRIAPSSHAGEHCRIPCGLRDQSGSCSRG